MKGPSALALILRYAAEIWQNASAVSRLRTRGNFSFDMPRLLEGDRYIHVGDATCIRRDAWFAAFALNNRGEQEPCIRIHEQVYIGFSSTITAVNRVEIMSGCVISDQFFASDHLHAHDPESGSPAMQSVESKGPVIVGKNCLIGIRVSLLPGVILGDHCVVGAHSVVTRSFPSGSMVAGAPARLIKRFDVVAKQWVRVEATGALPCQ